MTALVVAAAPGCVADAPLDVGAIQQAHITWNGLVFALDQEGDYTVQGQPWAPWIPLAGDALSSLQNDPLICLDQGPAIFSYVVKCALDERGTLEIDCTQVSGEELQFFGGLGLAVHWVHEPLSPTERLDMTACLGAHYNDDKGIEVSLRGLRLETSRLEIDQFRRREGAFWGDLFSMAPAVHVCSEEGYVVMPDGRDCATQTNLCGFIWHGPSCDSVCSPPAADGSFPDCMGASSVLTSFLKL